MSAKTPTVVEPGVWRIDRTRSTVGFRIRHFGVATVRGHFQSFDARIEAGEHGLRVDGHVDVASVDTGNQIRDERRRTEFFDAACHPSIALRASGAECLRGELTIRGVSRPVELVLTVDELEDGSTRLRADTKLRRSDFGLEWDALRQAGRLLVADELRLTADVVLTPARQRRRARG